MARGPASFGARSSSHEVGVYPNAKITFTPLLCNQCDDPACANVCPVGATQKQANGIVTVDADKCIGCRYCMVACPYNARHFVTSNATEYFPGKGLTPYEKAVYPAPTRREPWKSATSARNGWPRASSRPAFRPVPARP